MTIMLRLLTSLTHHRWRTTFQPLVLMLLSTGLFIGSAGQINLRGMTDIGIVVVLPPAIYVALVLLTISFTWTLHHAEHRDVLLLLHIVILIFILHGITVPAEEVSRFNVTWRHAGLVDYVLRNQAINPRIDAYFNWPAFFVLSAFVMEVLGFKDPIQLAVWQSVINSLLYIGPLLLILHAVTENRKLVWFSLWLFYLANWIGQDYYSPQALNYFIYITILGILLQCFKGTLSLPWLEKLLNVLHQGRLLTEAQEQQALLYGRSSARRQRLIGLLVILLASLFSVASHQLTPFAILISVAALSAFNQISARGLIYIIGIMISVWLAYMAVAYMQERTETLLSNIGRVNAALTENVTERMNGSPGHTLIIRIRLVQTLLFWGLAFLGGVYRARKNHLDLVPLLLVAPPFSLLALQFYGGEMLLRVYFFTLPFVVFFASGLIYTDFPKRFINWQPWLTGFVSLALISTFYLSRYGNEKIDQFTFKEVEAVDYLYKVAEPGALLAAPSPHYPIKYKGYELYSVKFYEKSILADDVNGLVLALEEKKTRASFFIITTSQESYFYIFYNYPPTRWEIFEARMVASGRFELLYVNEDARIYKLLRAP